MDFKKDEKEALIPKKTLNNSDTEKLRNTLINTIRTIIFIMPITWIIVWYFSPEMYYIIRCQAVLLITYFLIFSVMRKGALRHEEEHKKEGERHGIEGEIKSFTSGGFYLCNNKQYSCVPDFLEMLLAPLKKLFIKDCIISIGLTLVAYIYIKFTLGYADLEILIGFLMFSIIWLPYLLSAYIPDISTWFKLKEYKEYNVYMERDTAFDLSLTGKHADTIGKITYVIFDKKQLKQMDK